MEDKYKKYKNLSIILGKENINKQKEIKNLKESKKELEERTEELKYQNEKLINEKDEIEKLAEKEPKNYKMK